ncbi:hypothetical protein KDL01_18105 [Actinospica durhamensis]|uniref:Uncharacterized protein n=1 Tax=Actinospica durhamensis TaxID=1508375 RepID=A0A941ERK2_9ACTN|nr:hypothetical protein [Actinospica durhamensis]MBR7835192.1 hypothetical protein [Actinospica durhamensis]
MTTAVPGLAALPGPAAHLRRLVELTAGGRSCLWLLPDPVVACGDGDVLSAAVERSLTVGRIAARTVQPGSQTTGPLKRDGPDPLRGQAKSRVALSGDGPALYAGLRPAGFTVADLVGPHARSIGESIAEWSGLRLTQRILPDGGASEPDADDPFESIASRREVVIVRAWLEPSPLEIAAFARRLPALARVKSAGSPADAGRYLIASRIGDLPAGLISELDRGPDVDVLWWWGVVGRDDTGTLVGTQTVTPASQEGFGRIHEAVRKEAIVELAGPDLSLAMDLAAAWNGWRDCLESVLADAAPHVNRSQRIPGGGGSRASGVFSGSRPPAHILAAWESGMVDAGEDGRERALLRGEIGSGDLAAAINCRLWPAQLRVLYPAIEAKRNALAAGMVEAGAPSETSVLELGELRRRAADGRLWLSPREQRRLSVLLACRNALAHRQALSDAALRRCYAALV